MFRGIIAILKGKQTPAATAAGIAFGAILGLIPKNNMLPFLFFVLFFLTTVDKPATVLASILFTPLGFLLDGLAHQLGLMLLNHTALQGLWTALYNTPLVPWTNFNNTAVLGHLVIGAFLFFPLYFLSKKAIAHYQAKLKQVVGKIKIVQMVQGLRIYQWWDSIRQI